MPNKLGALFDFLILYQAVHGANQKNNVKLPYFSKTPLSGGQYGSIVAGLITGYFCDKV